MRRVPMLLATVVLAATVVAISPAPGSATAPVAAPVTAPAKCPAFRLSEAVKEPLVFHARVTGPGKARKGGAVDYPVTVVKALKGVTGGSSIKVTLNPGVCQRKSLTANEDYYFFVQQKGGTILAAGTQPRVAEYTDKLQAEIALEFPEVIAPEPQQVSFGPATSPEGQRLVTLVAPGVALFGIGILGLIIVLIIGRRRPAA